MGNKVEELQDYEQFTAYVDRLPNKGPKVYFFFTGKRKDNGRSWCMYCQLGNGSS